MSELKGNWTSSQLKAKLSELVKSNNREKKELESKQEKLYYQRFQFPLVIALVLLIYQTVVSYKKEVV